MNIKDVLITKLKVISDHRGKVMHMMRNDSSIFKSFGEIYFSIFLNNVVLLLLVFFVLLSDFNYTLTQQSSPQYAVSPSINLHGNNLTFPKCVSRDESSMERMAMYHRVSQGTYSRSLNYTHTV